MDSAPGPHLADEIARATPDYERREGPYLAKIRRLTSQVGSTDIGADDVRGALLAVEDHARVDLEVPTASRRKGAAFIKLIIKRLTGWYFRYVGDQITLLGQAIVRLGTALVSQTERLEEKSVTLADELAALEARVERLEQGPNSP